MNELDDLYDLRDEIDRLAQGFDAAAQPRQAHYEGGDDAGAVTVRVSPTGVVTHVGVATHWRDRVGPDGLPDAVLAAIQSASLSRLEDWGHGVEEAQSGPQPRARPVPGVYDTLAGQLEDRVRQSKSPAEAAAVQAALVEVMDEVLRSVDEVTADLDAALAASVSGRSGSGRVVAEIAPTGDLVALTYDHAWLDRAHAANLGRETLAAIDDARRALAGRSIADILAGSRLTELQTMLNNPDAVSQRLGL
ncbi:MAG: hypothetical protein ACRCYX_14335 [Dermatophilaceae bacterium]